MADYRLEQADCFDLLRSIPDASIDLIVTDPAYESLEKHRAVGTTTRLTKAWFPIFPNANFPQLFAEYYRVLKPDTHFYMFCDQETAFIVKPLLDNAGFKFWKPLIWDKCAIGMGYHYRCQYEFILFCEKGKRRINDLSVSDVLRHPRVTGGYPTEKPVELLKTLIAQSSLSSETVLDTFAGSGSTGEAAVACDRRFIGCDISETATTVTCGRLANAILRRAIGVSK